MRNRFDEQLELLNSELIAMGELCEKAITNAVDAMFECNIQKADNAIEIDSEIDKAEQNIEQLCLKMLLQQQPVAKDLRIISAAMKMITDMERIGDQASDIAEIVKINDLSGCSMLGEIRLQSKYAINMVFDSINAFVNKDAKKANEVIEFDDKVDALFLKIRNDVIDEIKSGGENANILVDVIMISKYFERIGDHATNIAEWVEYSVTGVHRKEELLRI